MTLSIHRHPCRQCGRPTTALGPCAVCVFEGQPKRRRGPARVGWKFIHEAAVLRQRFAGDHRADVWLDSNAVRGTALESVPWFWAVFHQGEMLGAHDSNGNCASEDDAKIAAVAFLRELGVRT